MIASIPERKKLPTGQLLIDGKWCDAVQGATMSTFDPTTEEKITDVAKAGAEDADRAVRAASSHLKKARGAACIMNSEPKCFSVSTICWTSELRISPCARRWIWACPIATSWKQSCPPVRDCFVTSAASPRRWGVVTGNPMSQA